MKKEQYKTMGDVIDEWEEENLNLLHQIPKKIIIQNRLIEREQFIKNQLNNKIKVLDIGSMNDNRRLFLEYRKINKNIIGIDLEGWYDLECFNKEVDISLFKPIFKADCQNFNLNQKFDLIICGEVIEHLSNFQGFFNSLRKHLTENGRVIITTPNPMSFMRLCQKLIKQEPSNDKYHTIMLDSITFSNMCHENGFKVVENYYYYEKHSTIWTYKLNNYISYIFPKYASGYLFIIKNI